ncbi:cell adhesion molecule 1-like [Stegodyphus dumicola]|uniref:cell adhesion molecule 1-like n=1 Tax=Stegodyphus dumicola TaxID=202533 RepID=UPI0015A8F2AE|nr:cell adhesion molecule 1-like [Stegodyphus dumicola]
MKLTIRNLQPEDYGSYQCVAKNAISETEGSIKLFKTVIPTPSPPKPVTEGMPTFPTRKVITVAVTTDHRSIFNDLERRENTNAPVKQQKYGDGRVSTDGENSVLRTDSDAVIYILVCLLSLWWGSSYKCCR